MPKHEFWDFNETKNYTIINIQGRNYKVLNIYPDYYTAAQILNSIYAIIYMICQYLEINKHSKKYTDYDRKLINCFC